jgi:hypothetical protein
MILWILRKPQSFPVLLFIGSGRQAFRIPPTCCRAVHFHVCGPFLCSIQAPPSLPVPAQTTQPLQFGWPIAAAQSFMPAGFP